jgi:hypothetical protein
MRRRAENHGGTLTVTARAGGGTRLTWSAICTPMRPASTGDATDRDRPLLPPPSPS